MDLEKLFSLVVHAKEQPGVPYSFGKGKTIPGKDLDSVIRRSVQFFFHSPASVLDASKKLAIQAFSGSSDLPALTHDVFDVTMKTPNFDMGWQQSFKGVRLMKGQLAWEISDVAIDEGFALVLEGEKVKTGSISGSSATVAVNKYGLQIGATWETIEGRKLYRFVQMMEMARAELYKLYADVHYGLLDVAAATNAVAWAGVTTDPVVDRDVKTINNAVVAIATAIADSGYGDAANGEYILYAGIALKDRIEAALKAVQANIIAGRPVGAASSVAGTQLRFNVRPVYTLNSNITTAKADLVFPGGKIQNAVYLKELALSRQDQDSLNELRTYWTAFGAAVGDADQCAQLSFS